MGFKRNISEFLILALLLSLLPPISFTSNTQAASLTYPDGGYCDEYKKHFDRTKIPNPSISDYLTGMSASDAAKEAKIIQADKLCMQIADYKRKLQMTTDGATRLQLQKELEAMIDSENQLKNELKAIAEMEERIAKFLEMLHALARLGTQQAAKSLIDTQALTLKELHEEKLEQDEEFEKQISDMAEYIKDFLTDYSESSFREKQKIKADLIEKVENEYGKLESELESVKQQLISNANATLELQLDAEERKFLSAVKEDIADEEELAKAIDAYSVFKQQQEEKYKNLAEDVIDSSFAEIDKISDVIESALGVSNTNMSMLRSVLMASAVSDVVQESPINTLNAVKGDIENFEKNKEIMQKLNALLHSADFQLLRILKDPVKTKAVIQAIEKDDHNNSKLIEILEGLTDEQEKEIDQAFEDAVDETYLLQDEYEDETEEENETEDVKSLCAQYKSLSQESCDTANRIAWLYGGYVDFIIDRLLKAPNTDLEKLETEAAAGWQLIQKQLLSQTGLSSAVKNFFRFHLLASLFEQGNRKLIIYYSGSGKYALVSTFIRLIALAAEQEEPQLPVVTDSCDTYLQSAMEDILGNDSVFSCQNITGGTVASSSIAYLPDVTAADGYTLKYHKGGEFMLRLKQGGDFDSLYIFDQNKNPVKKIDPYFAVFYSYDSSGRLIEKVKADPDTAWDKDKQDFVKPPVSKQLSRTTWEYAGSTTNVRTRKEYLNTNTPTKIIGLRYLSDDIKQTGSFTGYKKQFIEKMSNSSNQTLLSNSLSSVKITNTATGKVYSENHFYYDDFFRLQFIQNKRNSLTKYIFFSTTNESAVKAEYAGISKNAEIPVNEDTKIAYYLDSDGNIWDESRKVAYGLNSNLVASAAAVFAPYGTTAVGCALVDGPFFVGDIVAVGVAIVGIGAVVGYLIAYEAEVVTVETTVVASLYAFETITEVEYAYESIRLNRTKDDHSDYVTMYRGDKDTFDKLSKGFLANAVKNITGGLVEYVSGELIPDVYKTGKLDDMLDRHADDSSYSPFVSVTTSIPVATRFACGAKALSSKTILDSMLTGRAVFTLKIPKKLLIKNTLNIFEAEYLVPLWIPPWMIESSRFVTPAECAPYQMVK